MNQDKLKWQFFDEDCSECGESAMVFTTTGVDNQAHDGDFAQCERCKLNGYVVVEEDGTAWINWDN